MNWELFGVFATLALTTLGTTYGQFLSLRTLIYKMKDDILNKLEYHERHDDARFSQMNNDLWTLRLRNAALDKSINNIKDNDV